VQLNIDGRRVSGAALDHDTVSASLMAVMAALTKASRSPVMSGERRAGLAG
jgi:hypothetical protein